MKLNVRGFAQTAAAIGAGWQQGQMMARQEAQNEATQMFQRGLQGLQLAGQLYDQDQHRRAAQLQPYQDLINSGRLDLNSPQGQALQQWMMQQQQQNAAVPYPVTPGAIQQIIPNTPEFAGFRNFFQGMPQAAPAAAPGMMPQMPGGPAQPMQPQGQMPNPQPWQGMPYAGAQPGVQPGVPTGPQPGAYRQPAQPMLPTGPGVAPEIPNTQQPGQSPQMFQVPGFGGVPMATDPRTQKLDDSLYQTELEGRMTRLRDPKTTPEEAQALRREIQQLRQGYASKTPFDKSGVSALGAPAMDQKAAKDVGGQAAELLKKLQAVAGRIPKNDPAYKEVNAQLATALAGAPSAITTPDQLKAAEEWLRTNRTLSMFADSATQTLDEKQYLTDVNRYWKLLARLNPAGVEGEAPLAPDALAAHLSEMADLEQRLRTTYGNREGIPAYLTGEGNGEELKQLKGYLSGAAEARKKPGITVEINGRPATPADAQPNAAEENLARSRETAELLRSRVVGGLDKGSEQAALNNVYREINQLSAQDAADPRIVQEIFERNKVGYRAPKAALGRRLEERFQKMLDPGEWAQLSKLKPKDQQAFLDEFRATARALGKKEIEIPAEVALQDDPAALKKLASLDLTLKIKGAQLEKLEAEKKVISERMALQIDNLKLDKDYKTKRNAGTLPGKDGAAGGKGGKLDQRTAMALRDTMNAEWKQYFALLRQSRLRQGRDFDPTAKLESFPPKSEGRELARLYQSAQEKERTLFGFLGLNEQGRPKGGAAAGAEGSKIKAFGYHDENGQAKTFKPFDDGNVPSLGAKPDLQASVGMVNKKLLQSVIGLVRSGQYLKVRQLFGQGADNERAADAYILEAEERLSKGKKGN